MKKKRSSWEIWLLSAVAAGVLLIWFFTSVIRMEQTHAQQGAKQLETALRRAAVACYATEGIYPPNLDYLTDRYGIQIDENRYLVHYEIFADNLMPDITVLGKES